MADKGAIGLKDLRRAAGFSFKGITGNMRRCDVHLVKQRNVKLRLRLPDVQHHAKRLPLVQTFQQRKVIDHRAPAGIYQNSARLQMTDQGFVSKVQRLIRPLFKQRRMESDHIALCNQFIQRTEVAFITVVFARRIAQQGANA